MTSLPDLKGRLRLSSSRGQCTTPQANDLCEVVLHVLGVASGYRPRTFISGWAIDPKTQRSPLRDRILGACRLDPDTNLRIGLYTRLDEVLVLAQGYEGLPLMVQGDLLPGEEAKGRGPVGSWALTEAGVALAVKVHNEYMLTPDSTVPSEFRTYLTPRNVSCVWLDAQCTHHGLQQRLEEALSGLQQIRKERQAGTIQEHINTWIGLAIKRDGLRTRLETFDPPTFRQIKDWVLRSVFTTLRSRAQDADSRMLFGALTERERAKGGPATDAVTASPFVQVLKSSDEDGVAGLRGQEDLVDKDAYMRESHAADFRFGMEAVARAFETFRPGNADRLATIFEKMVEGHDVVEMAQSENVSRNRMASLLSAVRGALRDARQYSGLMVTVLEYLQENPWSTQRDLLEDIVFDANPEENPKVLVKVLTLLAKEERIQSRVFATGTVGYTATPQAQRFLASRDGSDILGSMIV